MYGRNTLRVRLYQKAIIMLLSSPLVFYLVAILCEYDYIKRIWTYPCILKTGVAILCEYDYIKRGELFQLLMNMLEVAILCEYDYIKSRSTTRAKLAKNKSQYSASTIISKAPRTADAYQRQKTRSQYSASTIISKGGYSMPTHVLDTQIVAILCEYDYIKRAVRGFSKSGNARVAILCEYDYIKSLTGCSNYQQSSYEESRNTLRVRLYQKCTSGNPCPARAPRAISKARPKISDAKGQSAYFTNCAHLYLT